MDRTEAGHGEKLDGFSTRQDTRALYPTQSYKLESQTPESPCESGKPRKQEVV